jgi:hypothetical protein
MGPTRCTETSVKDYHPTLLNIPEEGRSHQHRGGSLKSQYLLINNYYEAQQKAVLLLLSPCS